MSDFIYILPALITVFWVIRIFFKKDAVRSQLFVSVGMLMAAISLFYLNDTVSLIFPCLYLAVRCKTSASGISRYDWTLLLPSVLFLPYNTTLAFYIYLGVQVVVISVWCIVQVHRYNRLVAEYYVDSDSSSENLGEILAYVIATVFVISVLGILNDVADLSVWVRVGLVAFICVLQYLIGMKTFNISSDYDIGSDADISCDVDISCEADSDICSDAWPEQPDAGTVPEGSAQESAAMPPDSRLLQRVIDEKMFLDPMLSLVSLAAKLKTNRTYLSNTIHDCYNQNFSDFVNTQRIKYSLTLLENVDSDMSIKEIAMQSGYNHTQSFYRHFAEIMEMTPKAWLSRQQK